MGGRTYRYYNFREYEGGAFSRYLEEMAGKGWYIDGYVFDGVWRFRKGKPSNRHYNAILMPGSSNVDIDESGDTAAHWGRLKSEAPDFVWLFFPAVRVWTARTTGTPGRSFIRRTKLWFLSRPTRRFVWRTREELHFPGERCWGSCL